MNYNFSRNLLAQEVGAVDKHAICVTCDAQVPMLLLPAAQGLAQAAATAMVDKEEEVDSWLLLNKDDDSNDCNNNNGVYLGEVDEYQDLVVNSSYYDEKNQQVHYGLQEQQQQLMRYGEEGGRVYMVPSQLGVVACEQQQSSTGDGIVRMEQDASIATAGLTACTAPISNSSQISFLSMEEVALVPDNTIDPFTGPSLQMPMLFSPMEREARVLRYKEKKKARKFGKTIRYASRKAYAEARPRIKGRFAKRPDAELEVEQMLSPAVLSDSSYGTVPWF